MKDYYFYTKQLTVGYDGIPLIHQIEMQMKKGQILTLIGPNGAGKSTILKSITGQLAPLYGAIYFDGQSMSRFHQKEMAKQMAVVLTDSIHTDMLTCFDVVATGRYPYTGKFGLLSEQDKRIVEEAMTLVHTLELREQDFLTVSDGQRQRVLLARAIAQEPEILVLDEPTSYLDIKYKLEFLSILQTMAREKQLSVIMSLHELDLAQRVSDLILCVKGEYIRRFGPPEEIFKPGYISELYDIKDGIFDEGSGRAELPAVCGNPQVFVIAGGGTGVPVYRRLQRLGIPFATGILGENDIDFPVAGSLGVRVISRRAFDYAGEETCRLAEEEMNRCERVICCVKEFGEMNRENQRLMEQAKRQGKLEE